MFIYYNKYYIFDEKYVQCEKFFLLFFEII